MNSAPTTTLGSSRWRIAAAFVAVCAMLLCSGCLVDIQRRVCSPGATGIVLDAKTRQPLADAQVVVTEYNPPSGQSYDDPITISNALRYARKPRITTDQTGYFSIPAKSKLIVIIYFGDYFTPCGTLVVKRAGYQSRSICVCDLMSLSALTNSHGREVLLTPLPN